MDLLRDDPTERDQSLPPRFLRQRLPQLGQTDLAPCRLARLSRGPPACDPDMVLLLDRCDAVLAANRQAATKRKPKLTGIPPRVQSSWICVPYVCSFQNGKQEAFWGTVEGRLMEMLDGHRELTLEFLNQATQAWVEIEYNRAVHREISCSPVERFAQSPDVLRSSPSSNALREAFRLESKRRQRQSDGTISLEGVRFEIPARFRHFHDIAVRYARWDLGRVDLVDSRNDTLLAPLYPLDRTANADGRRALIEPPGLDESVADRQQPRQLPPLLKKILEEYSATGLPPAYLPQKTHSQTTEGEAR